jgi:hypothetical protein
MRFFNTAGPVNCADHYCLPPLERFELVDNLGLIEQKIGFLRPDETPEGGCER